MKRYFVTFTLGVVLVGAVAARTLRRSHSQGLSVGIVTTQCSSPGYNSEENRYRWLRLRIDEKGNLFLNDDPESPTELPGRLMDCYRTRYEKVLFFDASDSVSYQQTIAAMDLAQSAVPGLRVILIAPSTRKCLEQLRRNGGAA